jgi:hypothetical protein
MLDFMRRQQGMAMLNQLDQLHQLDQLGQLEDLWPGQVPP